MRAFGSVVAVALVAVLGAAPAVMVAAPAGAGDIPGDQVDVPVVDGVTITATYRYEGKPFFEGGFVLPRPQMDNFVSIDCGATGAVNPVGGPGGAPECGFHPAVTEATVTITGQVPWFEVDRSFELVPYWSFDDKTYVKGDPITVKAPKTSSKVITKEVAGQRYLDIAEPVNQQSAAAVEKIKAWLEDTTGKEAAADVAFLDRALDKAKKKLKKLQKAYPPAKEEIAAQLEAIDAVKADLAVVPAINEGVDLAEWKEQFNGHLAGLKDASDGVRAELGLILVFEPQSE